MGKEFLYIFSMTNFEKHSIYMYSITELEIVDPFNITLPSWDIFCRQNIDFSICASTRR